MRRFPVGCVNSVGHPKAPRDNPWRYKQRADDSLKSSVAPLECSRLMNALKMFGLRLGI